MHPRQDVKEILAQNKDISDRPLSYKIRLLLVMFGTSPSNGQHKFPIVPPVTDLVSVLSLIFFYFSPLSLV